MRLYRISHGLQSEKQDRELCVTNFKTHALNFWEEIVFNLGDGFKSQMIGNDIYITNDLEYYYYQVLDINDDIIK